MAMKLVLFAALAAVTLPVAAKEIGSVSNGRAAIVLFDDANDCPTGTTAALYIDHRQRVKGCWYEWLGNVRLTFDDDDSFVIPRAKFTVRSL